METNTIIENEEVIETVGEAVKSHKGLKVTTGVGIAVLAGVAAYKFVVKPVVTKIKNKRDTERYRVVMNDLKSDDYEETEKTE